MSGPLVPGAGFAKGLDPLIDLLFEFVFVDEAVDLQGAEKMTAAFRAQRRKRRTTRKCFLNNKSRVAVSGSFKLMRKRNCGSDDSFRR